MKYLRVLKNLMNYGGVSSRLQLGKYTINLSDVNLMAVKNFLGKFSLMLGDVWKAPHHNRTRVRLFSCLILFHFGRVNHDQWVIPHRTCIFKHYPDNRPIEREQDDTVKTSRLFAAVLDGIITLKLSSRCRLYLHSKWLCQ